MFRGLETRDQQQDFNSQCASSEPDYVVSGCFGALHTVCDVIISDNQTGSERVLILLLKHRI